MYVGTFWMIVFMTLVKSCSPLWIIGQLGSFQDVADNLIHVINGLMREQKTQSFSKEYL